MDSVNNASPRSYLDFQGLGELRGQAARDGKGALRETAQQFEAMFLQMMLKSMRESIEKSDLMGSQHTDTFEAMFDREVSVAMARRNAVGLADMLVDVQTRQMSAITPAAEALRSREAGSAKGLSLDTPQPALPLEPQAPSLAPLRKPGAPMLLNRLNTALTRSQP